jgi:beta-galactosidase
MTSRKFSLKITVVLTGFAAIGLCSCSKSPSTPADGTNQTSQASAPSEAPTSATGTTRQRTLLDTNWQFHLGDLPQSEAIAPANDDSQWQQVDVPHDYVLDGKYTDLPDSADKQYRSHAYLPYRPAWYRKHFTIPASDAGKVLRLDFDGVFRDSKVWLNGQFLGEHPSGYTPFSYDISQIAKLGADNVITVRVNPSKWEGWWYEGGGIYRHVNLTALSPLHVAQWGTYVVATVPNGDQGADDEADLTLQTTVENSESAPASCEVISDIIGPDGKELKTIKTDETAPASARSEVNQQAVIEKPQLWSLESPQLYQLHTTVLKDGTPVDSTTTTFGIRTIRYDADKGFFLNGKHVEIQGTANHQDFPGVGIAVPDSLEPWRVEKLKEMGCNGWRTAHNPPNESVLDACDRLGMLVMDENRHLADAQGPKSPSGTTCTNFSDLDTMILRDRNHPSIIMWSMCNEETLQGKPEGARLMSKMMQEVHRYDTTRPITCAMSGGWLTNGIADVEDIVGINYNTRVYDRVHERYPDKALFGSEDTNEKTTRGEYIDTNDAVTGMCSCYNLSDKDWLAVVNRPFMCGSYTWTGFDYKGEPNPSGWPDVSNNTGLLDGCGFPKDKSYYFESCWSDKPMVHVMPGTWNMPGREGQPVRVIAFSNARQVELFLNGQSLGAQDMPHDGHLEWQVPYQPGQLLAKAYIDGKTVATDVVETTTAPAQIQLSSDRTTLYAKGEDAIVVPVSILDDQGRVVPDAANRVTFQLTGDGKILGVGNGDPADHDPDRADNRTTFHGRCIVVIEAGTQPGTLQLTASSPGLTSGNASFSVE